MHPALSIVVFTSLSGAGYGALAWLGLLAALGALPGDPLPGAIAGTAALALVTAGLMASVFHLRRPERAWRALSQWRTSWLSREGVAALASYGPALAFLACWLWEGRVAPAVAALGLAAALSALATVACTAMIYRSLWTVPHWHNSWTLPSFLAMGLAGGALVAVAGLAPGAAVLGLALPPAALPLAGCALAAALAVEFGAWRARTRAAAASDAPGALGLVGRAERARLLEAPATAPTWLQREMVFAVARRHAARLRRLALLAGVPLPALLLAAAAAWSGWPGALLALAAAVCGIAATMVTRWLFFAEARHKVALYFGAGQV